MVPDPGRAGTKPCPDCGVVPRDGATCGSARPGSRDRPLMITRVLPPAATCRLAMSEGSQAALAGTVTGPACQASQNAGDLGRAGPRPDNQAAKDVQRQPAQLQSDARTPGRRRQSRGRAHVRGRIRGRQRDSGRRLARARGRQPPSARNARGGGRDRPPRRHATAGAACPAGERALGWRAAPGCRWPARHAGRNAGEQARQRPQECQLRPARRAPRQVFLHPCTLVRIGGAQHVHPKRHHHLAGHGPVIPCFSSSLRSARNP